MRATLWPARSSPFATRSARRFVRVKTSVVTSSRSRSARSSASFSCCVGEEDAAARRARRWSRCARPRRGRGRAGAPARSRRPPAAIVAEKSIVCRFFGSRARIRVELGLEPHVEHPVGLVEDEDLDVVELRRALLQVIDEPARAWRRRPRGLVAERLPSARPCRRRR